MVPCVLVRGVLDRPCLDGVLNDIMSVLDHSTGPVHFLIDSPGGDIVPALDFIEMVQELLAGRDRGVKIYRADSAAALIAIAIAEHREIRRDASLGFHFATIENLSSTEIDPDGRVSEPFRRAIERCNAVVLSTLARVRVDRDPILMGQLYGSGWLRLSAEECLRRSIVQRVF